MIQSDLLAGVALFILALHLTSNARHDLPLPLRSKGLPLIGNLLDIPDNFEWEDVPAMVQGIWYYAFIQLPDNWRSLNRVSWSDSDIVYLDVAGTYLILLNFARHRRACYWAPCETILHILGPV